MAEGEALLSGGFRCGEERNADLGESSLFALLEVLGDSEGDVLSILAGGVAVIERDCSVMLSE